MPGHVGDGLGERAAEREALGQGPGGVPGGQGGGVGQLGAEGEVGGQDGGDGGGQGGEVRLRGGAAVVAAQDPDHVAHGRQGRVRGVAHGGECLAQVGLVAQGQTGGGLHLDGGEGVPHEVVQLAGDGQALGAHRGGGGVGDEAVALLGGAACGRGVQERGHDRQDAHQREAEGRALVRRTEAGVTQAHDGDRVDHGAGQGGQERAHSPAAVRFPTGDGVQRGRGGEDDRVEAQVHGGDVGQRRVRRQQAVGGHERGAQVRAPPRLDQGQGRGEDEVGDVDGVRAVAEEEADGGDDGEEAEDPRQDEVSQGHGARAAGGPHHACTGAPVQRRRCDRCWGRAWSGHPTRVGHPPARPSTCHRTVPRSVAFRDEIGCAEV